MAKKKIYECYICHKILEEYKPIRIVRQQYGINGYNQYGTYCHYDFCKECYSKIDRWIKKHRQ